ncbi:MAG TPA: hypothetical protein DCP49_08125 [Erysipelotrichaceae bacterium]|nr:hypothetical protein [Erysipelotrichaceae bacterium]
MAPFVHYRKKCLIFEAKKRIAQDQDKFTCECFISYVCTDIARYFISKKIRRYWTGTKICVLFEKSGIHIMKIERSDVKMHYEHKTDNEIVWLRF